MTARGKPGKPKTRFPPFPPSLESSQSQRASHIPTASTTVLYIGKTLSKAGLTAEPKPSTRRVGQNKLPKWTKITCQTQLDQNHRFARHAYDGKQSAIGALLCLWT